MIIIQTTDDDDIALQLAYTTLERRYQELDAINKSLRDEITKILEGKFSVLDDEIEAHQKFVFFLFIKNSFYQNIYSFRRIDEAVRQNLDNAMNDLTIPTSESIA